MGLLDEMKDLLNRHSNAGNAAAGVVAPEAGTPAPANPVAAPAANPETPALTAEAVKEMVAQGIAAAMQSPQQPVNSAPSNEAPAVPAPAAPAMPASPAVAAPVATAQSQQVNGYDWVAQMTPEQVADMMMKDPSAFDGAFAGQST